jgi:hypothetical protein
VNPVPDPLLLRKSGSSGNRTRWKSTDVSEEYVAFIFRTEEWAKQETGMKRAADRDLLATCFNPEHEGDMFLRNVG